MALLPGWKPRNRGIVCVLLCLAGAGCTGGLGVEGGEGALSQRFPGVDSATVLSPTSVTLKWTPLAGYTSYNIYISTQDAPVGSSVFNTYTLAGLRPGTSYSFSVSAVSANGSQDGIGKQVTAQTWSPFLGVTSASVKDASSINLVWNYFLGPTFQIFYNIGSPAGAAQLLGSPNASSQSKSGTTVGGLQPNTTYYFSVIAKYPDGTSTLQALTLPSTTISAQYTSSTLIQSSLPAISTPATLITGNSAMFTTSGGAGSLVTYIFDSSVTPGGCTLASWLGTPLAQISGSGTASTSSTFSSVGTFFSPNILVRDTISGNCATASLGTAQGAASTGVQIVQNPVSAVPYASATTPTAINPLPIVTGPGLQLGGFPTFTVSSALPSYHTTIYYNPPQAGPVTAGTNIGSVNGNGPIQTLSSTPLPRGVDVVYPVVTSGGQTAFLPAINVTVKGIDPAPITGPTKINGGGFGGGLGEALAVGDFNCDGYPDLAVGIPFGSFTQPYAQWYQSGDQGAGAVAVYYGSSTGLIGLDTSAASPHAGTGIAPVIAPTGKNPLLISSPLAYNYLGGGAHFGATLSSGFINGTPAAGGPSVGGHACSDLVVGAPADYTEGGAGWASGAIYVYYGAPTGLQGGQYEINSVSCSTPGSFLCGVGKYFPPQSDLARGYVTGDTRGFGSAVAVGDFNGDGFDDVAVGDPVVTDSDATVSTTYDGAVWIYFGTSNGLSPAPQKILMPKNTTAANSSYFGTSLAFGFISDSTSAPFNDVFGGTTDYRKMDLIVGAPNLSNATGGGGVFWIKGTSSIATALDANSHLTTANLGSVYSIIQPAQCNPASGAFFNSGACGMRAAAADLNLDGWDDILFSDPWAQAHHPGTWGNSGAIFAYYGSTSGPMGGGIVPAANVTTCTTPNQPTCNPQMIYAGNDYPNWFFGSSLAVLGDTNGDGYPDIGIGANGAAPARNSNYTNNGVAYVYYSGALGLSTAPGPTIDLTAPANAQFGSAMAGADFRNKTYGSGTCSGVNCTDIVVGSPGESLVAGANAHGVAHFFANTGNGFAGAVSSDDGALDNLPAKPVAEGFNNARIAGDINGDGYADVISPIWYTGPLGNQAASWSYPAYPTMRWGAVVYYGSASGLVLQDTNGVGPAFVPMTPSSPLLITDLAFGGGGFNDDSLGAVVTPAGDMNGDGYADVAMGSANRLYLFYGSHNGLVAYSLQGGVVTGAAPLASPASTLDPKIISTGTWVGTGNPGLSTHGDFNGDSYSDLAVTNWYYTQTGIITIIYGSAAGAVSGGAIYNVEEAGYAGQANPLNQAVRTAACTGTWPSQTCQPLEICTGQTAPCATVSGSLLDPAFRMPGYTGNPAYNTATYLASVGDVDKDGTDDLAVGSALDTSLDTLLGGSAGSSYTGAVYLFYGSTSGGLDQNRYAKLLLTPGYNAAQDAAGYSLGRYAPSSEIGLWSSSLSRAYDINGDGIGDFVVGSARETSGPSKYYEGGAAYVIYGINGGYKSLGASVCANYPCTVQLTAAAGNTPDYQANHLVDNVNNSCNPLTNQCNPMRFYPYNFNYAGWQFGASILGMGDITGDAFGEIAVTAQGVAPGRIFLYSGSQNGLQTAGTPSSQPSCISGVCAPYYFYPPATGAFAPSNNMTLSYSLYGFSEAGDIDKDGKRDFLISSPSLNDPNGNAFLTGGFFLFR